MSTFDRVDRARSGVGESVGDSEGTTDVRVDATGSEGESVVDGGNTVAFERDQVNVEVCTDEGYDVDDSEGMNTAEGVIVAVETRELDGSGEA